MKAAEKRGLPAHGSDSPGWRFAHVVRATFGRVLLAVFRVRFLGRERFPESGVVLAGNHVSYLDPILLWCGVPRPTHFMAKTELWGNKLLGWALDNFWAFQVERSGADREAITTATRLLKEGEPVGIFPEGTRKRNGGTGEGGLGEAQGGAAFIAMRAQAPVIPVGIVGTEKAWPAGKRLPRLVRVTVSFGEPLDPADFAAGSRKERVAAFTSAIMDAIAHEVETARGSEGGAASDAR
ncbi:MAG: 1-acyl-sn-glycerol-3-phosphate acyltransferase [Coriobacteriia bacterium]|nr:1-acyl-sn-glycerol-3-phosphate acyltransferase [Coriobacteriia bacterium]